MIRRGLAFLLGMAAIGVLLARGLPSAGLRSEAEAVAPEVVLSTLDGRTLRLSEQRGTLVLLNFWATWCAPCRLEMPLLEDRARRDAGRLQVWGVNAAESPPQVQAFVQDLALTFPILLDVAGEAQARYRVRGYPTTVLVGREGQLLERRVGILSAAQLDAWLEEASLSP